MRNSGPSPGMSTQCSNPFRNFGMFHRWIRFPLGCPGRLRVYRWSACMGCIWIAWSMGSCSGPWVTQRRFCRLVHQSSLRRCGSLFIHLLICSCWICNHPHIYKCECRQRILWSFRATSKRRHLPCPLRLVAFSAQASKVLTCQTSHQSTRGT